MKFKLPALSYKRGFVRLYVVLAVAWIVALLFALPSHRLRVWDKPITVWKTVDYDALSREHGGLPEDPYAKFGGSIVRESGFAKLPPPPAGYVLDKTPMPPGWRRIPETPPTQQDIRDLAAQLKIIEVPGVGKVAFPDTMSDADIGAAIKKAQSRPDHSDIGFIPDPRPAFAESRTGKMLWLAGMLFGPPVAGYLAAFLIVPWVYRGFRPTVAV